MTVKKILTATSLQAESHQANTNSTPHGSSRNHTRVPTRMSDPNVKMVPTETKTSGSRATHTVRLADARICRNEGVAYPYTHALPCMSLAAAPVISSALSFM